MERPSPPEPPAEPGLVRCAKCGAPFTCGIAAGKGGCWCFDLPKAVAVPREAGKEGCWCESCLRRKIDEMRDAQPLQSPLP